VEPERDALFALLNLSDVLHRAVNHAVDFYPRSVVRRRDQRAVRVFEVLARDRIEPDADVLDFVHATLSVEGLDSLLDFTAGELFDYKSFIYISLNVAERMGFATGRGVDLQEVTAISFGTIRRNRANDRVETRIAHAEN
jgi:hypothetical protein